MTRGRTCLPTVTATSTRSSVAWAPVARSVRGAPTTRRAAVDARPARTRRRSASACRASVSARSQSLERRRVASPRTGRRSSRTSVAVPVRAAHDEQALHAPRRTEPRAQRLDLRREASHRLAAVEQEVPDLDDRRLPASGAAEQHVDRARPASLVERRLRDRRPAAGLRRRDDEVLPPQVLDVPGQVRPGHRLDERRQLDVERRRAGAQRLERRARLAPSFDPAEVRLRDPCGARGVDLTKTLRKARFLQARPDPARDGIGAGAAASLCSSGASPAPAIGRGCRSCMPTTFSRQHLPAALPGRGRSRSPDMRPTYGRRAGRADRAGAGHQRRPFPAR